MRKFFWRYLPIILVFFLILLGLLVRYFYKNDISYENPLLKEETEAQILVRRVGELVLLPKDEVPTIATVSNPELLKDKPFFAEAKKGDQVLIYSNAKKAILYDPKINKIITMAVINISAEVLPNVQNGQQQILDAGGENQF